MSAAYKCDRCKAIHDGLSQNNRGRVIVSRGVRDPKNDGSSAYPEDLCSKCVDEFETWYTGGQLAK
jgi:hypothetical protein